ncbi:MAG: hypothetical protein HQL90_09715 [Magnetococcales bacterium]|nr:hypothetical protein [Magnetococcales bacterium]
MNESFILAPEQWSPAEHGPEEIRQTSGFLRIRIQNRLATRVDDDRARSVRDTVLVSCYPLAVWFASSWWRLCWEPTPETTPGVDWCLSHEMRGAGHGFLWPHLRFESDGETITVVCTPSAEDSNEPVRYLTGCRESIPVGLFAESVESFIQTVLARLDIIGIQNTELHTLWREVSMERSHSQFASYRKLEAVLGLDPDDAPAYIENFLQLSKGAGESAMVEVAAACAGLDASLILNNIRERMDSEGIMGDFSALQGLRMADWPDRPHCEPWERGRTLARKMRAVLGNGMEPIKDRHLCDLFGLKVEDLTADHAPTARIPWSLAIREVGGSQVSLLFRHKSLSGRRFNLARWLGDHFSAPGGDRWLPVTNTKTARQKVQRAFAAEFLAPIDAVKSFLDGDFTDEDRIVEAGTYFGVSPLMVKSHLSNHRLVLPETVGVY